MHLSFSLSSQAYSILGRSPSSVAEQCQIDASKLLVLLNLSVTYLKLEHPDRALMYGEKALEIDHRNAKALFRCGQVGKKISLVTASSNDPKSLPVEST